MAEKVLSVADSAQTRFTVHDQPTGLQTVIEDYLQRAEAVPICRPTFTLTACSGAMILWVSQGALEAYIDGKPIVNHLVPINDPSWGGGAYCYAGWMQHGTGSPGAEGCQTTRTRLRMTRSISGASRSGNCSEP